MEKLDYKKEYKDLYQPARVPVLIDIPAMNFIMIDGQGAPDGEAYQKAMQALYALSFTIKMSKMGGAQPEGYFEYVVPPLEGLWWCHGGRLDINLPRQEWLWTSMIRQPEFVTNSVFEWACAECRKKKPEIDISGARFVPFQEGLCVQTMHIGPYAEERKTLEGMEAFLSSESLRDCSGKDRKHHEIYLSDPRKTKPERLKTVLRLPVERIIV